MYEMGLTNELFCIFLLVIVKFGQPKSTQQQTHCSILAKPIAFVAKGDYTFLIRKSSVCDFASGLTYVFGPCPRLLH